MKYLGVGLLCRCSSVVTFGFEKSLEIMEAMVEKKTYYNRKEFASQELRRGDQGYPPGWDNPDAVLAHGERPPQSSFFCAKRKTLPCEHLVSPTLPERETTASNC